MKHLTFKDGAGRYCIAALAYEDRSKPSDEPEEVMISRVIGRLRAHYGLTQDHPIFIVDSDALARRKETLGLTQRRQWEIDGFGLPTLG